MARANSLLTEFGTFAKKWPHFQISIDIGGDMQIEISTATIWTHVMIVAGANMLQTDLGTFATKWPHLK